MEERGKTETNFDTGYSSDSERTRIGGWGLGRQEDVQDTVKS